MLLADPAAFYYTNRHCLYTGIINLSVVCMYMCIVYIRILWLFSYLHIMCIHPHTHRSALIKHDHYVLAAAKMELGFLYIDQGRLTEAEELLHSAKLVVKSIVVTSEGDISLFSDS